MNNCVELSSNFRFYAMYKNSSHAIFVSPFWLSQYSEALYGCAGVITRASMHHSYLPLGIVDRILLGKAPDTCVAVCDVIYNFSSQQIEVYHSTGVLTEFCETV